MPPCYEDLVAPSGVTSGAAAALASVHALLSAAVALASTARSISRREKKGQCVQGVFFYLVAPLARTQPLLLNATTQVQVVLGEAVLRRGAVAGAIRGTAIAVHRRRNTDPPAMAGQPAVGTPCKQAPRQLHQPGLIDGCVMRINSASIVNQSAHTYS